MGLLQRSEEREIEIKRKIENLISNKLVYLLLEKDKRSLYGLLNFLCQQTTSCNSGQRERPSLQVDIAQHCRVTFNMVGLLRRFFKQKVAATVFHQR